MKCINVKYIVYSMWKNGLYAFWILFLLSPAISGSAVAIILGKGFLAIRKAGHLCVQTHTQDYSDYSGREKLMEVRVDVLKPGTCVCKLIYCQYKGW